jgi:hypothetical protein
MFLVPSLALPSFDEMGNDLHPSASMIFVTVLSFMFLFGREKQKRNLTIGG